MQHDEHGKEYHSGDCTIVPATRRLLRDGKEVEIEAKVFDLALLLMRNHERALGKQEIIEALWGHRPITDAALSQLIYKARRACGDDGERQRVIRTIYGRGLQWVASVTCVAAGSRPAEDASSNDTAIETAAPRQPRNFKRHWVMPTALITTLLILAAIAWMTIPHVVASSPPRVALLPIENQTGEKDLDWVQRGLPGLMTGLLDNARDIEVVDPLQVARAWSFTPPAGQSRGEHVRQIMGASVVVSGKLHKLAGKLYQLTLHIATEKDATDLALTGTEPDVLAVAAVARVRDALGARQASPSGFEAPGDSYLAQTFARGMDAATRGRWSDARPYFALVAHNAPDFLPGRFRLGQSQLRTDQQPAGEHTLQSALADAKDRRMSVLAVRIEEELAYQHVSQHRYSSALHLLKDVLEQAGRNGDPEAQADARILMSTAYGRLNNIPAAQEQLREAKLLIDRHGLRRFKPQWLNAQGALADAQHDLAGEEKAARESLDASEAIGDERNAIWSAFNLAYVILQRPGRNNEALPLLQRAWKWGLAHSDYPIYSYAGYNLAEQLQKSDAANQAMQILGRLSNDAEHRGDGNMRAMTAYLRARIEWMQGADDAALKDSRSASELAGHGTDPANTLSAWLAEATFSLAAEPGAAADASRRADQLIGKQSDPSAYRQSQTLLRALAAQAANDNAAARKIFLSAADPSAKDFDETVLRRTGLMLSLASHDPFFAETALRGYVPDRDSHAGILHAYARWAMEQGKARERDKAMARLTVLHTAALDALVVNPLPGSDMSSRFN